ncbi:hypothetical protein GA0115251_10309, partial [Streptomyces sp. TverLS-915]
MLSTRPPLHAFPRALPGAGRTTPGARTRGGARDGAGNAGRAAGDWRVREGAGKDGVRGPFGARRGAGGGAGYGVAGARGTGYGVARDGQADVTPPGGPAPAPAKSPARPGYAP